MKACGSKNELSHCTFIVQQVPGLRYNLQLAITATQHIIYTLYINITLYIHVTTGETNKDFAKRICAMPEFARVREKTLKDTWCLKWN